MPDHELRCAEHTVTREDTLDGADVIDQAPEPDDVPTDSYAKKPRPRKSVKRRPRIQRARPDA